MTFRGLLLANLFAMALVVGGIFLLENRHSSALHENQVAGCERVNVTVRGPLHDFLVAFVRDERTERDDKELLRTAILLRDSTDLVPCEEVIDQPGLLGSVAPS